MQRKRITYNILNIVTAVVVTMFFSCSNDLKDIQKIGISENEPIGEAEHIKLVHTDSGKVRAILVSPLRLDYSNRRFPFEEYPKGIVLDVFDDKNEKTNIVANYAIHYKNTKLIDLQGDVVITTHEGQVLKTEQLYFDQENEWLFSNHLVEVTSDGDFLGKGYIFDCNTDFSLVKIYEMHDSQMVIEEQ